MRQTTNNIDCRSIIDAYERGEEIVHIAQILNMPPSTVRSVVNVYINSDRLTQSLRGGQRRRSLSQVHCDALKE